MKKLLNQKWINSRIAQSILLIAVGVLLYGKSIGYAYVWDDSIIFLDKNDLMARPFSWSLIAQPVLENTSYFRPMIFLTWFLEFHFFGQNPMVSHAINLIIFLINILLVRYMAVGVFINNKKPKAALWATLTGFVYMVHPALIESTAWIAGRFDLLCTTFMLGAVITAIDTKTSAVWRAVGVALFTFLALACKELGVMVPVIVFCMWMAIYSDKKASLVVNIKNLFQAQKLTIVGMLVVLLAYLLIREQSVDKMYHVAITKEYIKEFVLAKLVPLEALKMYVAMAFYPFRMVSIFHPVSDIDFDSLGGMVGNIFIFILLIGIIGAALIKQESWAWIILAGVSCLVLVVHIIPMTIDNNITQDRFMTSALVFWVLGFFSLPWARFVNAGIHIKRSVKYFSLATLLIAWCFLAAVTTFTVSDFWKTPLTLWNWTYSLHPNVNSVRHNYYQAALTHGRFDILEKELNKIQKEQNGFDVMNQIMYAAVLTRKNDNEALNYLEGVIYALPKFHEMPNGREKIKTFPLTASMIASAYFENAAAQLIFKGSTDVALENNKIAQWYLTDGEAMPLLYQEATIYYASGKNEKAKQIIESNENIYYYNKPMLFAGVKTTLRIYCNNQFKELKIHPAPCLQLMRENIIPARSGS